MMSSVGPKVPLMGKMHKCTLATKQYLSFAIGPIRTYLTEEVLSVTLSNFVLLSLFGY